MDESCHGYTDPEQAQNEVDGLTCQGASPPSPVMDQSRTRAARIKALLYWLRWISVLPGALLAGVVALFILHWVLYATFREIIQPYPEMPERLLTTSAFASGMIWGGAQIAPTHRYEAASILFGVFLALIGGVATLAIIGFRGMRMEYGGTAPILSVFAAIATLFLVRWQERNRE